MDMNEVYETLAGAFESLRNDTGSREHYIRLEECDAAEKEMHKSEILYGQSMEKIPEDCRKNISEYLDAAASYHFYEEQRAYYQGIIDGILLMDGLGMFRQNVEIEEILAKIKK